MVTLIHFVYKFIVMPLLMWWANTVDALTDTGNMPALERLFYFSILGILVGMAGVAITTTIF